MLGKHRRVQPVINITSLIDVMFLLLIFFMVTSTFLERPGLKLDLPQALSAETVQREKIEISVTREGDVFLDGMIVTMAELEERLGDAVQKDNQTSVVLRADENAKYGRIIAVMDITRRCGLKKVVAFTKTPEQKRRDG